MLLLKLRSLLKGISIPGNTVSRLYILEDVVCSLEIVHAIGFAKVAAFFRTMKNIHRGVVKKPNDGARVIITSIVGVVFGYFIGVNFPYVDHTTITFPLSIHSSCEETTTKDQSNTFEFNSPEFLGSVDTHVTPPVPRSNQLGVQIKDGLRYKSIGFRDQPAPVSCWSQLPVSCQQNKSNPHGDSSPEPYKARRNRKDPTTRGHRRKIPVFPSQDNKQNPTHHHWEVTYVASLQNLGL